MDNSFGLIDVWFYATTQCRIGKAWMPYVPQIGQHINVSFDVDSRLLLDNDPWWEVVDVRWTITRSAEDGAISNYDPCAPRLGEGTDKIRVEVWMKEIDVKKITSLYE